MSTKVLEVLEKSPITDFPDTVLFLFVFRPSLFAAK